MKQIWDFLSELNRKFYEIYIYGINAVFFVTKFINNKYAIMWIHDTYKLYL